MSELTGRVYVYTFIRLSILDNMTGHDGLNEMTCLQSEDGRASILKVQTFDVVSIISLHIRSM